MSCYHPLKRFSIGINPQTGKSLGKVVPYETDHIEKIRGSYIPVTVSNRSDLADSCFYEYVEIPCGQCIGCRLDYSRQWADRMLLEYDHTKKACFVTLTYNDTFVPHTDISEDIYTLRKEDLQKFMKRLREHFDGVEIRFYACGEYGSHTFRPHYHIILFGLDKEDFAEKPEKCKFNCNECFRICGKNEIGNNYYSSCLLSYLWPYGFSMVADYSWNSGAYVSRYVTKKLKGTSKELYEQFHLVPPFTQMSLKPGIGSFYYQENKEKFKELDIIPIPTEKGSKEIYRPKYFTNKLEKEFPEIFEEKKYLSQFLRERRKENIEMQTSLCYTDYLEVCEYNKINQLKVFDLRDPDIVPVCR